ncbi:hypothetical protein VCHC50A2_1565B, partial [Vibrio cholerae HC-50A2]
LLMSTKIIS